MSGKLNQQPQNKLNATGTAHDAVNHFLQQPPARGARIITFALCAFGAVGLIYSSLAKLDVVVSAQGKVIPSGKSKVVQPSEAGVISLILVAEGQHVKKGDALVELDPTVTEAERIRLQQEFMQVQADVTRLNALVQGKAPVFTKDTPADVAQAQLSRYRVQSAETSTKLASLDADIARKKAELSAQGAVVTQARSSTDLVTKKNAMRSDLAKQGFMSGNAAIEGQIEVTNAQREFANAQSKLTEVEGGLRVTQQQRVQAMAEQQSKYSNELSEAVRRTENLRQELAKATQRRSLQVLRSPIDGNVLQVLISTEGGVVTQAQQIMVIVPEDEKLEIEAQIANRDIGHLRSGQVATVKVDTFDFTRYGAIDGSVRWVGTDAVVDQKLGPIYPVRVQMASLQTPQAVNGNTGRLYPGMSVMVDVTIEQRRLITYLLSPLAKYKSEAMRER